MSELIKKISSDLKIDKLSIESIDAFNSRVIYSALSSWIKISTLDKHLFEENIGVSKVHIINRCKPFLNIMLEAYPNSIKWFYPDSKRKIRDPIIMVRERLYRIGELVDSDFNSDLFLPEYKEVIVEKIKIFRGYKENLNIQACGIGCLIDINSEGIQNLSHLFDFYYINRCNAKDYFLKRTKKIKWIRQQEMKLDIFDKYLKVPLPKSFNSGLRSGEKSIYKKNICDYGFIKRREDEYYISEISSYEINEKEVYRFMYGLKNSVNNKQVATYKYIQQDEVYILKLNSPLPKKEESVLLLFGWPLKNINDKYNLIFLKSIWNFIKALLENLDINLQEDK